MEKARKENPNNQGEQFSPKSATTVNPVDTRDVLSKIAKVGHDTYNKGIKIVDLEEQANKGEVISELPLRYRKFELLKSGVHVRIRLEGYRILPANSDNNRRVHLKVGYVYNRTEFTLYKNIFPSSLLF